MRATRVQGQQFKALRALLAAMLLPVVLVARGGAVGPQTSSLTGFLSYVWSDPATGEPQLDIYLSDDGSSSTRLSFSAGSHPTYSDLIRLSGRRVTVTGAVTGDLAPEFTVQRLLLSDTTGMAAAAPVTGSQAWVSILCRFGDATSITPAAKSYFDTILASTASPSLDEYWREQSYGLMNLAGSVVEGYFNLPQPRSFYIYDVDGDGKTNLDFERISNDCTAVADDVVDFTAFSGINLFFNQSLSDQGAAHGGTRTLTRDGVTKTWRMTWMPAGLNTFGLMAHETGHGYGLPHSSGPYGQVYDSEWDVMSGGFWPKPQGTIGYHKQMVAWIPDSRVYVSAVGSSATVTIEESSIATSGSSFLMAKIPISGTRFYTIEARRLAGYDATIPADAVLIHDVMTVGRSSHAWVVDPDNNGDPNDDGARWLSGETFVDIANGISVRVLARTETSATVEISVLCNTGEQLIVNTFAGSAGIPGSANGTGSEARFNLPRGIVFDAAGNAFVSDFGSHIIRKITPAGVVTTFAGSPGAAGSANGTGSAARFFQPAGLAIDSAGTLYVCDSGNHTIRKISSAGVVTTLAGSPGALGIADGTGATARFHFPYGIVVDSALTAYVADTWNHTIRTITAAGVVSTLAGLGGVSGNAEGSGSAARFNLPFALTFDTGGTLYITDSWNQLIRKVTTTGTVTNVAGLAGVIGVTDGTGTAARFTFPQGISRDGSGGFYVSDMHSFILRRLTTTGAVTTVAGLGFTQGSADGLGSNARFNHPAGLAVNAAGELLIADLDNHTIRKAVRAATLCEQATTRQLLQNGTFANGTSNWFVYEVPDIVSSVVNGVFQFHKAFPTVTPSGQATVFQETGEAVPAGAPLLAQFDLGNSSTVRKRLSVLLIESDFSDLSVCTFWLAPNTPLRTYQMRARTTKAWTNAAIYFYAATSGSDGGNYLIDNVSLVTNFGQSEERADCVDPTVPPPTGAAMSSNLLANGDFASGGLGPWGTFGAIAFQIAGGVFEFVRPIAPAGTPAGVVLQATAAPMDAGQILSATLKLGNSSAVRKRVTVLLHDLDFTDLTACTFWLRPGQPLSTYTMRGFTTKAWIDATFSLYGATSGSEQWIRFDDAVLQRSPATAIPGTECIEPGGEIANAAEDATGAVSRVPTALTATTWLVGGGFRTTASHEGVGTAWQAEAWTTARAVLSSAGPIDLTAATHAHLSFQSWLSGMSSGANVEVSLDGITWQTIAAVPPTEGWAPIHVSLDAFLGRRVFLRFTYDGVAPTLGQPPDIWRIDQVSVTVTTSSSARPSAGARNRLTAP